jgi:hypothetical protein
MSLVWHRSSGPKTSPSRFDSATVKLMATYQVSQLLFRKQWLMQSKIALDKQQLARSLLSAVDLVIDGSRAGLRSETYSHWRIRSNAVRAAASATASLFFGFLLYGGLLASAMVAARIRPLDPVRQEPPISSVAAIPLLPVTLIAGGEAGARVPPAGFRRIERPTRYCPNATTFLPTGIARPAAPNCEVVASGK